MNVQSATNSSLVSSACVGRTIVRTIVIPRATFEKMQFFSSYATSSYTTQARYVSAVTLVAARIAQQSYSSCNHLKKRSPICRGCFLGVTENHLFVIQHIRSGRERNVTSATVQYDAKVQLKRGGMYDDIATASADYKRQMKHNCALERRDRAQK